MKTSNKKERLQSKVRFTLFYIVTIGVIAVMLSSFWGSVPDTKTIIVTGKQPSKEIVKEVKIKVPVYVNDTKAADSLKVLMTAYIKQIQTLTAENTNQKNTLAQLQTKLNNKRPVVTNNNSGNKIAAAADVNKQIEFLDWALRSQVAITNTLTNENNTLKAKIAQLSK